MFKLWNTIPLYKKILGALIFGAVFGALFSVSKHELKLTYGEPGKTVVAVIEQWRQIRFIERDSALASFGTEDQVLILQYLKQVESGMKRGTVDVAFVDKGGSETYYRAVRKIERTQTIATVIKPIGQFFFRLLMFVAIPMVFASLIAGAASLGDIRRVGKLGGKTISFYLLTITSAITLGLLLVNLIEPGTRLSDEAKERLLTGFAVETREDLPQVDLIDMIVRIVPTNPVSALANAEMLQIIFFALMIGVALTLVKPERARPVVAFFEGFSDLMIQMVNMIMKFAPYGVFALIGAVVAEFGFEILGTLFWYALTLILGLAIQTFVILPLYARWFGGMPMTTFVKGIRETMLVAFTTSSSAATLPVNMDNCEKNLGVPKKISSFVLPLGATINMDGTSMYQAVATVFIAQVYSMDLTIAQQLTILLTAVLASIGTAPVPGVGIIMLVIVLKSVNVPEEGIALILGVDRFLDMCRTVTNVTGDATVAVIIAKTEGVLEKKW